MAANLMKRNGIAGFAIALSVLIAAATPAVSEIFPTRPVTMMVGFPPGGPTDTLARIVADAMQGPLGQPVVVETLSGASGTIATGRVAHARPDGYTIGIGQWSSHVASPAIYPLDYDIVRDLQPISLLAASPLWIIGKEALPPQTMAELIAWMKARPEPTSFGTVGTGSAGHLCGLYFAQHAGLRLQYVPYRGGGPAMQDLIGGQIDLACLEASSGLAFVQAGKFKAYAVMSERRWPIPPFSSGWKPSVKSSFRATSRARRRLPPIIRRRSTNGGRSSRPPASRPNKFLVVRIPDQIAGIAGAGRNSIGT